MFDRYLKNTPINYFLYAILLVTILAYIGFFLNQEYFIYDDNWYIFGNENVINTSWDSIVTSFTSTKMYQYSPLAELYHAMIYNFFGKKIETFNFFALLNHLINTILVFKILSKITTEKWLIIFVSAIFALHPMQVETMGWLSVVYRLAVLFNLLAVLFYFKYLENNREKKYLILVTFFFILSLFTKELAVLFPVALVSIHLFRGTNLLKKSYILEFLYWVSICLIYGLLYVKYVVEIVPPDGGIKEVPLDEKFYILSYTILSYFKYFLVPFNLSFHYPMEQAYSSGKLNLILIILANSLVLAILIFGALKNKFIRFGVIWAFGFLSLALSISFSNIRNRFMHDHYIYLAIVGFAFLFIYSLRKLGYYLFKNHKVSSIICVSYIIMLIILSCDRVKVFQNEKNLWSDALKADSTNLTARLYLGNVYRRKGDLNSSIAVFQKGLKINSNVREFYRELSIGQLETGLYDDALININKAIQLKSSTSLLDDLGIRIAIFDRQKEYLKKVNDISAILKLKNVDSIRYLTYRATDYFRLQDYAKCIADCNSVIASDKATYFVYTLKGQSLYILDQYKDAIDAFTMAINLNSPDYKCYYIRSLSYFKLNEFKLAYNDILLAEKHGFKVPEDYSIQLLNIVKK